MKKKAPAKKKPMPFLPVPVISVAQVQVSPDTFDVRVLQTLGASTFLVKRRVLMKGDTLTLTIQAGAVEG